MEGTNSDKFYILKPGDKVLVDQIRRKVYMDGMVYGWNGQVPY
jgi:hypothetical protein